MDILDLAGLTEEEKALCKDRFERSGLGVTYDEWCRGYVLLNSTKTAEELGLDGEIPALQQAFLDHATGKNKKPVSKKKINFKLGSYRK